MDREQRVRERAYLIWEEEGRPSGREREHWERAARESEAVSSLSEEAVGDNTPPPSHAPIAAPAAEEPAPSPQTASPKRAGKIAAKKPAARSSKSKTGKTVA